MLHSLELCLVLQRTSAKIKIFMEPMPNSNERSIQIIGSHDQIIECIQHFLNEISKVSGATVGHKNIIMMGVTSLSLTSFHCRKSHVSQFFSMNLELQISVNFHQGGVVVVEEGGSPTEGGAEDRYVQAVLAVLSKWLLLGCRNIFY